MQTSISAMTPAEAELMMEQVRQEGWNPGIRDAVTFNKVNPNGLLCSHIGGKPIGFSSVMIYDQHYAFFGLYLVYKEFRGQGHGMEMTRRCLSLAGKRCIGLDGVTNNINMYAKIGFRPTYRNLRYLLSRENAPYPQNFDIAITPITNVPRHQLCSFDYTYFPACRSRFLDIWCYQPGATALCALNDGELVGYIVVRPCVFGSKVGPLFARTKAAAWELLSAATESSTRWPLILDIPEPNYRAVNLASELRMELTGEVVRMHIGTPRSIDMSGVYSVTNLETG
ncbi:GNAT family N-acetyltransferase [Sansalvadorimonas sp. 2012CJ34-2]|uniref:GNAT family N-acetyltransferase n=1 Tax=Parendozoicomonas callyspongiae TaxID=2942213 RepID=A0ABT0PG34_9GAMM|nr:GNAT family N-acetyltransferase [Sansalvadorimonas sp. 2012CJ34-2]MCL6270335.1 GNAT family N-acetyltransferase [Sansalvadorimonas sp. 2012CJ34-2]